MNTSFITKLIVRSYELDSYGHVNNAAYLNYLEAARCDCMNQVGLSFNDFKQWGKFPVVAEAHLHYRAPSFSDDVLTIKTTISQMRRASFQMTFEVTNQRGQLVLNAMMAFLFLNDKGKPTRVPALFAEAFAQEG